jgi:hypothetical protein
VAEGRIETNEKYPIIRGWDFGVAYAACVFAQYIPEPHPVLNILHEITHRQTNALEFGGPVRAISSLLFPKHEFIDRGDPAGKARSIATGDTAFKVLAKEHGINVVQAPTNDAGKRIAALTEAFSRVGYGGRPFIRISNGVGTQFLRDGLMAGWSRGRTSTPTRATRWGTSSAPCLASRIS